MIILLPLHIYLSFDLDEEYYQVLKQAYEAEIL